MSHQCIADAFAPAEARHKERIMQDTWGHLAPKRNKKYKGFIVFAVGCCGSDRLNPTALSIELKGLDGSPWFQDCMEDYMRSIETEEGGVYRFDGFFCNYKFEGAVRKLGLI